MWPDDQYSDMNTLMSGENFATHGLFRLHMLPMHYIGALTDPPSCYTHYPPLPNVMNGLVRIIGVDSLAVMRILCGVLFLTGLVCLYLAFASTIGALPAVCGLGFIATTGYFFTYCVSVHQHGYNVFFMGVFVLLFTRGVGDKSRATGAWIGCWLALMCESLASFEFIIYPQIFAWLYVLATGQIRKRWPVLALLATAPVAGVGLHFVQNCWALGWSDAVTDAADAFRRPGRGPAQDRWLILSRVPDFVLSHSQRLFYWSWPVLPLLAGVWLALSSHQRPSNANRRTVALVLAAMVASVTWYFFMPTHTVKHPHTMSQLLLLVMIAMGGVIAVIIRWITARQSGAAARAIAVLAAIVIVYGQKQSIADCFQRSSTQRPISFYLFEAMGEHALPPNVGVLTNTYADAQLAYFIRRPLWRSPTPMLPFDHESLVALQARLPDDWKLRYYIFDSRGDRSAFKTLASTCPGQLISLPGARQRHVLILFDISPLLIGPPGERALPPDVKKAQLEGRFPDWDDPGFGERLRDVLGKHGKL
jgi:hypothetical protein